MKLEEPSKINANKSQGVFKCRQEEFVNNLDNLFDNALQIMEIEEGKFF